MLCALFLIFILFFLIGTCLGSYKEWNRGSTPYPLLFLARKVQRRKKQNGKSEMLITDSPSLSIFQAVVHIRHIFNKSRKGPGYWTVWKDIFGQVTLKDNVKDKVNQFRRKSRTSLFWLLGTCGNRQSPHSRGLQSEPIHTGHRFPARPFLGSDGRHHVDRQPHSFLQTLALTGQGRSVAMCSAVPRSHQAPAQFHFSFLFKFQILSLSWPHPLPLANSSPNFPRGRSWCEDIFLYLQCMGREPCCQGNQEPCTSSASVGSTILIGRNLAVCVTHLSFVDMRR